MCGGGDGGWWMVDGACVCVCVCVPETGQIDDSLFYALTTV